MAPSLTAFRNPSTLFDPTPFGFSHVSVTEPSARLVHLAGQVALDQTGEVVGTFEEQVRMTFTSIKACLAEAGASLEDVVNLTVYVVDYASNTNILQLLPEMLTLESGKVHRPPTALIPVPALAIPNLQVEIAAVAAVGVAASSETAL